MAELKWNGVRQADFSDANRLFRDAYDMFNQGLQVGVNTGERLLANAEQNTTNAIINEANKANTPEDWADPVFQQALQEKIAQAGSWANGEAINEYMAKRPTTLDENALLKSKREQAQMIQADTQNLNSALMAINNGEDATQFISQLQSPESIQMIMDANKQAQSMKMQQQGMDITKAQFAQEQEEFAYKQSENRRKSINDINASNLAIDTEIANIEAQLVPQSVRQSNGTYITISLPDAETAPLRTRLEALKTMRQENNTQLEGLKNTSISNNFSELGSLSQKYESSNGGVNTISSGKNDAGGQSYGKHQIASNTGTMNSFLNSKEGSIYKDAFNGLKPGTTEFNKVYNEIVSTNPEEMAQAQKSFLDRTHYEPKAKYASELGYDLNNKGIQEAIYSMSIQHGGANKIFKAVADSGVDMSNPEAVLTALYKERSKYALKHVKDKNEAQNIVNNRYPNELADAIALSRESTNSNNSNTQKNINNIVEASNSNNTELMEDIPMDSTTIPDNVPRNELGTVYGSNVQPNTNVGVYNERQANILRENNSRAFDKYENAIKIIDSLKEGEQISSKQLNNLYTTINETQDILDKELASIQSKEYTANEKAIKTDANEALNSFTNYSKEPFTRNNNMLKGVLLDNKDIGSNLNNTNDWLGFTDSSKEEYDKVISSYIDSAFKGNNVPSIINSIVKILPNDSAQGLQEIIKTIKDIPELNENILRGIFAEFVQTYRPDGNSDDWFEDETKMRKDFNEQASKYILDTILEKYGNASKLLQFANK